MAANKLWDKTRTASENARSVLPVLAAEYFREGRKATKSRLSHERLHRFRLKTKRFRYMLEIFGPLYGPSFRRLLNSMREVQNHLGRMSDFATMHALFLDHPRFATSVKRRANKHAAAFRAYWISEFDAEGNEDRWVTYLGRFGRTRKG